MNKKNKNKNRNKIPNPVPPKNENDNLITESEKKIPENKVDIVPEKEILPKTEIIAETHRDVIQKTSDNQEQEETSANTPKKPKRNRNKKKKGEIEVIDSHTVSSQDDSKIDIQDSNKTAQINIEEMSKELERPVTPASDRKNKKNKKQNVEPTIKIAPADIIKDQSITISDKESIDVNITQTENKEKKKHKKGKKRNDSEKSEEIVACTAAFQKLILKEETPIEAKNIETEITEPASESSVSEATVTEAIPKKLDTERPKTPDIPKKLDTGRPKSPDIPKKLDTGRPKTPDIPKKLDTGRPKTPDIPKKLDTGRPKTPDIPKKLDTGRPKSPNIPKELNTERPKSPNIQITTKCETKDCSKEKTDLNTESHKKGKHKKHAKEPPVIKEIESTTATVTDAFDKVKGDTEILDIPIAERESLKTPEAADVISSVTEESKNISTEQETLDKNNEGENLKKSNKKKKHKPIPPVIEAVTEQNTKEEIKIDILEPVTESKHDDLEKPHQENLEIQSKSLIEGNVDLTLQKLETVDQTCAAAQGIVEDTHIDVKPSLEMRDQGEPFDAKVCHKNKAKIAKPVKKDAKRPTNTSDMTQPSKSSQEELLSSLDIKKDNEEIIVSPTCSLSEKSTEKNIKTDITETSKFETQHIQSLDKDNKTKIDDKTNMIITEEKYIPTESKIEEIATEQPQKIITPLTNPEIGTDIKNKTFEVSEIKSKAEEQVEKPNQSKTDSLKRQKKRNKHQIAFDLPNQEIKDTIVSKDPDTNIKIESFQENLTVKSDLPDLPITTPDQIEYPRPASADGGDLKKTAIDITVTEITHTDNKCIIKEQDYKVEVPSTKLPTVPPIEIKAKKPKTDLKSKVIEVNKDMEDLKISIEKSLAELTALEDKEKEIEHNFETKLQESLKDTQKAEEITDAGLKKELSKEPKLKPVSITQDIPVPTEVSAIKQTEEKQEQKPETVKPETKPLIDTQHPTAPSRKDNKGKNKKKKGEQDMQSSTSPAASSTITTATTEQTVTTTEKKKSEDNKETKDKSKDGQGKGKQQSDAPDNETNREGLVICEGPIENFEDALTSSADDVNQTFDMIVKESSCDELDNDDDQIKEEEQKNENIPQPKNLLGQPEIPVPSNKIDYKKEKNKTPNARQARVKIKDGSDLSKDSDKASKECQTTNKPKIIKRKNESSTYSTYDNEEFIYKYSFRNVFLTSACHVCKKLLTNSRVECNFCHLFFYCSQKHKDKDWSQHQALCFAVSTITHLKGEKHIYAGSQNVTGQNYRLLRMQMIISCEKILKRKLAAWEQEAVLYPRICADPACREWRSAELEDCGGCQQISYCSKSPEHLPPSHTRWCKSYSLYQRLVIHQLLYGRIEPTLPKKCITERRICDNLNRVLADMYDEKIDMDDVQYASLTQIATAPLTAVYCYQIYHTNMEKTFGDNWQKNHLFTIHVVEAELQWEADSLTKWETFFLHLKPDVQELRVTLVGTDLNPSNLPLDLLGKVRMCESCRSKNRKVVFKFHDKMHYHDYYHSIDFVKPDIVCAFNTAIYRSSSYNTSDIWSPTLKCIFKQHIPLVLTSYSMTDLQKDMKFIEKRFINEFNVVTEGKFNPFASVRPDRNFISDDDMPLLFKNYCFCVVIGAF